MYVSILPFPAFTFHCWNARWAALHHFRRRCDMLGHDASRKNHLSWPFRPWVSTDGETWGGKRCTSQWRGAVLDLSVMHHLDTTLALGRPRTLGGIYVGPQRIFVLPVADHLIFFRYSTWDLQHTVGYFCTLGCDCAPVIPSLFLPSLCLYLFFFSQDPRRSCPDRELDARI